MTPGRSVDVVVPPHIRARLAVALDVDDIVDAIRIGRAVTPYFGIAKVGLELYSAGGPEAVEEMREEGFDVFVDLKLHDIPTTVARAARVLGSLGVRFVTIHTQGGLDMVRAGVEGLAEGAEAAGAGACLALGVTVLTSDPHHSGAIVAERVEIARVAGCGGVVCSAADLGTVSALAPDLVTVVPGIRPTGADPGDQVRVATPATAARSGAKVLVIGRPITTAPDPALAAREVAGEAMAAFSETGG